MNVFGYAQSMTAEQADEGASLATQQDQQDLTGYAMMKGWKVDEFFRRGWRLGLRAIRQTALRASASSRLRARATSLSPPSSIAPSVTPATR